MIMDSEIFPRGKQVSMPTKRGIKRMIEMFRNWNLESEIVYYEREAQNILANSKDELAREDAQNVLASAYLLRRYVEIDNAGACAMCGIALGRSGTRMLVRPFEGPARAGRRGLANLEKGRIQGQDRYSAARERHFDWRHRSLEMTGTTREIAEKIAVQTKYKAETIRKALQKLRKKNSSVGKIRA
jgi:hypothetical protein